MKFENVFYLPSGRVFLYRTNDGYPIECTEMRDVDINGKLNAEVRTSQDPQVIWKHVVPYENKWLMTVSTQKGCVHKCQFCDVPNLPFKGNLTYNEIYEQVQNILINTPYVNKCNKVKIGFARMGEPSHNLDNVLKVIRSLKTISVWQRRNFNWLPCFNSILPKKLMNNYDIEDVIKQVIEVKEKDYNGFLHFQISCNSTDEEKRKELFGGAEVLPIEEVINIINKEKITNRTITLNFIVMKGIQVDVDKLVKMGLDGNKFCVKLIPLNITNRAQNNKLETVANYNNFEDLVKLGEKFNSKGIKTVIDAIAKCEEAGLCCGQLAHIHK